MKLRTFIIMMSLMLLLCGVAFAEDADKVSASGAVKLGVRYVEDHNNSAKFLEYRDLDDGVFGKLKLNVEKGPYFLNFTGENIGQDDQYYRMNGGKYGYFKYSLYYDETIHNLSFGAKTFYSGIGHGTLDYGYANAAPTSTTFVPTVPTNTTLWNPFDYSIQRKDVGASVDVTLNSPFFITVSTNQLETKGLRPVGAPTGVFRDIRYAAAQTSAFGNVVELPAPVDYTTNNFAIDAGYNSKKLILSLGWLYSKFENDNDYLTWRTPYVTSTTIYEKTSLAADSDYYKLSLQGALKQLPLNSVLSARVSYAKLKNELDLLSTLPTATAVGGNTSPVYTQSTALGLSDTKFNGDIKYKTASVALTSTPVKALNTKIYYNYLRKDNDSDEITYTAPDGTGTDTNELFGYKKSNFGADIGYKLPKQTKASVGYEYMKVRRDAEREDAETTTDNSVYIEFKNSYLDFLTAKVRYTHLWRSSDFENDEDPTDISFYQRRFDATDKDMDTLKVAFDLTPLQHLDIGLEYIYKKNKYDETVIGRTSDKRNEFLVDASYNHHGLFRVDAFFDYEVVKYDSTHRQYTNSEIATAAPVANEYNWDATLKDKNWAYGIGVDVPVLKNRLNLITGWTYEKANGKADFTSQNDFGTPIDITEYDDYKKSAFNTKVVYKVMKALDMTLGYAYERLKYDDQQWTGYTNVFATGTSGPNTLLTGAYVDNDYSANIVYLAAKYKF